MKIFKATCLLGAGALSFLLSGQMLSAAPMDSSNLLIRHHSSNIVSICSPVGTDELSCHYAQIPGSAGKLTKVLEAPGIIQTKGSWFAVTDTKLLLCAIAQGTASFYCRELDDASLDAETGSVANNANRELPVAKSGTEANFKSHTDQIARATDLLNSSLRDGICVPDGGSDDPSEWCGNVEQEPAPDPCANGGCPVVLVPGPTSPSLPPVVVLPPPGGVPGGSSSGPSPEEMRCQQGCQAIYDKVDAPVCRKMSGARAKALCWSGAAIKLGACMAKC